MPTHPDDPRSTPGATPDPAPAAHIPAPPPPIPEALTRPVDVPESLRRARAAGSQGPAQAAGDIAKGFGPALEFLATIAAAAFLGWAFDRWQRSQPTGMMVGLAVGFVVAFVRIVRDSLRQDRAATTRAAPRDPPSRPHA